MLIVPFCNPALCRFRGKKNRPGADEFPETDHFPPQLYIREARRLVGDKVFTQNDVTDQTHKPLGNASIGMGCCKDPGGTVLYCIVTVL